MADKKAKTTSRTSKTQRTGRSAPASRRRSTARTTKPAIPKTLNDQLGCASTGAIYDMCAEVVYDDCGGDSWETAVVTTDGFSFGFKRISHDEIDAPVLQEALRLDGAQDDHSLDGEVRLVEAFRVRPLGSAQTLQVLWFTHSGAVLSSWGGSQSNFDTDGHLTGAIIACLRQSDEASSGRASS